MVTPPCERSGNMGFFSVNVFNRKKLMVDTDAEAIANKVIEVLGK